MIQPVGARVLVRRIAEQTKSSFIEVVEHDPAPSKFAMVLAIGTLQHGGISPGDCVVVKEYAGAPCRVTLDGDTVDAHIVTEDDVLAVVEV